MKTIYTSKKPELKTSPDHYFGKPNVVAFAFKDGKLLYSAPEGKDSKVFLNGKVIDVAKENFTHMIHRQLVSQYNKVTNSEENKETWVRGRTDSTRTKINLWGHYQEKELANILNYLQKYDILKPKNSYEVGLVSKQGGSEIYEIVPGEYAPEVQVKPHTEIRKGIYAKLGLESKLKKLLNILREGLKIDE
jgi:hypothetical protein